MQVLIHQLQDKAIVLHVLMEVYQQEVPTQVVVFVLRALMLILTTQVALTVKLATIVQVVLKEVAVY